MVPLILAFFVPQTFGRIDTWVSNAGIIIYSEIEKITPEEYKRVMEVNYMGQVHGVLVFTFSLLTPPPSYLHIVLIGCIAIHEETRWWCVGSCCIYRGTHPLTLLGSLHGV